MKFNKITFFGTLFMSVALSAHKYDHYKIEELKAILYAQDEKLAQKDKVIAHSAKVIAIQAGIIVALEEEVHHLKHEVRKESKYHELKKELVEILKSMGF